MARNVPDSRLLAVMEPEELGDIVAAAFHTIGLRRHAAYAALRELERRATRQKSRRCPENES